jgi:hypothetical protein
MCALMFKSSPRPHEKIADTLASTLACATANTSVNYTGGACHRDFEKFPSLPWETHVLLVVLQAGGVYVGYNSAVSIVNSQIYSNTASVRAHVQNYPSPTMGRWLTCPNRLSSFNSDRYLDLACATATDALVNYRGCVLQRP